MTVTRPIRRTSRGFTLLEVLLATVAFAIVLASINAVFYSALRLRNRSVEAMERSRPLERAVSVIKRDLANLVLPGGVMSGSLQTTSITNTIIGQISPEFYTASGFVDPTSPWADIQKVSYALVPSGDPSTPGSDLIRAVTRNLLPPIMTLPPDTEWLLSGVQQVVFYYYDGLQWLGYWDSTTGNPNTGETNALPKAVKVQIYLAPRPGSRVTRPAPVEIVVPILVEAQPVATTGVDE